MKDRKELEAEFHDAREQDRNMLSDAEFQKKYSNKKWYSVTQMSHSYIREIVSKWAGKKVLDYCCGLGGSSVMLAELGCNVTGIDISPEEIKTAKKRSKIRGGGRQMYIRCRRCRT